jgi:hypothetical protein
MTRRRAERVFAAALATRSASADRRERRGPAPGWRDDPLHAMLVPAGNPTPSGGYR